MRHRPRERLEIPVPLPDARRHETVDTAKLAAFTPTVGDITLEDWETHYGCRVIHMLKRCSTRIVAVPKLGKVAVGPQVHAPSRGRFSRAYNASCDQKFIFTIR